MKVESNSSEWSLWRYRTPPIMVSSHPSSGGRAKMVFSKCRRQPILVGRLTFKTPTAPVFWIDLLRPPPCQARPWPLLAASFHLSLNLSASSRPPRNGYGKLLESLMLSCKVLVLTSWHCQRHSSKHGAWPRRTVSVLKTLLNSCR